MKARLFFPVILMLVFISIFFINCNQPDMPIQPKEDIIWFKQPAKDWNEALPLGNGRLRSNGFW